MSPKQQERRFDPGYARTFLARLPADNQPDAGYEITQFNDFAGIRRYEEGRMIYEPEDIADAGELARRILSWAASCIRSE